MISERNELSGMWGIITIYGYYEPGLLFANRGSIKELKDDFNARGEQRMLLTSIWSIINHNSEAILKAFLFRHEFCRV